MKSNAYNTAVSIIRKLRGHGFAAYIVGGTVRDLLLAGNKTNNINSAADIDIATSATPDKINNLFEKTYNIGAAFGIVNVVINGVSFEVATFRKESGYNDGRHPEHIKYTDSPELDACRRDFTINALFYDPIKDEVLDFCGGQEDLKKGILRTIGSSEKRFTEDYLRMLRAIRFGIRFDLKIENDIIGAIKKLAHKIQDLSMERVRDELNKIFTGPRPEKALRLLSDTGILSIVLPEIEAMKGVKQPEEFHPEGDVFEHTALMLANAVHPDVELAWAVLLHDVGKPKTFHVNEKNRECFYYHDEEGAVIAEEILTRLRFPKASIARICFAIKNHMRFAFVDRMRMGKLKRLIAESTFPMELELHRLDCCSSHKMMHNFVHLLDTVSEQKGETKLPPPLITGKDLIELGLKPGPEFGKILKTIEEKQIEKELLTKEDAIDWVSTQLSIK